MEFDQFTITLLTTGPSGAELDGESAARIQDAHLSYLADLHDAGQLLAAGPLVDPHYRGLSILNVDPEAARALTEQDPAVRAGVFAVQPIAWMVPGGAITFSHTRLPRSVRDVTGP
jgi:uncharacterized protein